MIDIHQASRTQPHSARLELVQDQVNQKPISVLLSKYRRVSATLTTGDRNKSVRRRETVLNMSNLKVINFHACRNKIRTLHSSVGMAGRRNLVYK